MNGFIHRLAQLDWPPEITRPALETDYQAYDITPETAPTFGQRFGINVIARPGTRNVLLLSRKFTRMRQRFNVSFSGSRNIVLFEENTGAAGGIGCSNDCVAVVMGHQHQVVQLDARIDPKGEFFWGRHSRTFGCLLNIHGGKRVT